MKSSECLGWFTLTPADFIFTPILNTRWVLSRADGDGGFLLNPKSLDSFGYAPKTVSNLFILYALLSANVPVDEPAIKAGISGMESSIL